MDSTLCIRAARALLALLACTGAAAANHDTTMAPVRPGPFTVACSSVELDMARLNAIGGQPTDYWEGAEVAGANRYITEVLAHPESALVYRAQVPLKLSIYPLYFGRGVDFAAIVCHPTPRDNPDPDYLIPVQGGVVPHMQPGGASPKLITAGEFAQTVGLAAPSSPQAPARLPLIMFSHGLGGSPLGPGYIDVLKALAAQGYMVGAVFHADNRFSKVRIQDLSDLAYALAFFPAVVEMQAMRPLALKAMTDALLSSAGFSPGIDQTRIGGFGASLGGEAMIHLLGSRITASLSKACDDPVYDPRLRAAVGYVPYAGQSFLPAFCEGQSGARFVDRPFLGISGTADTTAPLTMARQAINNMASSRYLVELAGGQHELAPENVPDVLTWTVTFLNAYLNVPWDEAMARFVRMRDVAANGPDTLTIDAHVPGPPPAGATRAFEYFDPQSGRYVMAVGENEIASAASQGGLQPMDLGFKGASGTPPGAIPTCRASTPAAGTLMGVGDFECGLIARARGASALEWPMGLLPFDVSAGACPPALLEVDRAWAPAPSGFSAVFPNGRLTTSASELRAMAAAGWKVAGPVGCASP